MAGGTFLLAASKRTHFLLRAPEAVPVIIGLRTQCAVCVLKAQQPASIVVVANVFDRRGQILRYTSCGGCYNVASYAVPTQPRTVGIRFGQDFWITASARTPDTHRPVTRLNAR